MPLKLATHDGSFHADDVLAAALIRVFLDPDAEVIRSRDPSVLAQADIVFDVGHVFDPSARRFDHHQRDYDGSRSSAGMVLDYLQSEGHVKSSVASKLRRDLVDHVDAVDTGVAEPTDGVPTFSMLVGTLTERAGDDFDPWYERAAGIAADVVCGIRAGVLRAEAAVSKVETAMREAEATGDRILRLPHYVKWKPAYFAAGGATHPTEFVVFPTDDSWRLLTIPVAPHSYEDKQKLPEAWAGLEGEALSEVIGVEGARFCHRNRFIAVFDTEHALRAALARLPEHR